VEPQVARQEVKQPATEKPPPPKAEVVEPKKVSEEDKAAAAKAYAKGNEELKAGRWQPALGYFYRVGALNPEFEPAFEQHCYASLMLGHSSDAVLSCAVARLRKPNAMRAMMLSGYAYLLAREYEQAIKIVRRGADGKPKFCARLFWARSWARKAGISSRSSGGF
jgi:tetratricopeptide (TPR) repeat protein